MKVSLQVALAALIVAGCLIPWTFGQQPTPPMGPAATAPPAVGTGSFQAIPFTTAGGGQTVIVISPEGKVVGEVPAREKYQDYTADPSGTPPGKMRGSVRRDPPDFTSSDGGRMWLNEPSRMMPGGRPGMTPGMSAMTAKPTLDPEAAKLYASEEEAAWDALALTNQLRNTLLDEKERADVIEKLREALNRQFDLQQKRRDLEVGKIEERLGKLKETMKKREEAKETIISRRLDELSGASDDLGWEETEIRVRARGDGTGAGGGFGTSDHRDPAAPLGVLVSPHKPTKPASVTIPK